MTVRCLFLWHLHQPDYRDPESGQPLLPWVRLHSTRSYTDMAAALERFPEVRCVVNWAPSLLLQLEAYAAGSAVDVDDELARRPADSLNPAERAHVLKESFSVDWDLWVKPVPRYKELLLRRGMDLKRVDLLRAQAEFSEQDLVDLQVHFALSWMGFAARREEPLVAELLLKERGFTEGEKRALLDVQRRIAGRVVPRWRRLAERGQVELSCSPLYHPILPLLIDSDCARRAMPGAQLPPRFAWPQDARLQVERGLAVMERVFGARPQGMWPSEGSVSPEVAQLFAELGVRWCATDADVLRRSDRLGHFEEPLHLRPWGALPEGGPAVFFRDRDLSDRLGFRYAKADPREAVQDLLQRLAGAGSPALDGEGGALVTLALDGENPWERYPRSGEAFLEALYAALSAPGCPVRTSLPREELAAGPPARRLARLHSGSWIESSFRIWIGHPEDNEAWALLGQARSALAEEEAARRLPEEALARARDALLPAEGSDWFWWYGDDFETENAAEFDALFRRRVALVFRALGRPAPERLSRPLIAAHKEKAAARDQVTEPHRLIHPVIDGVVHGYFEWLGAGSWRPGRTIGSAMHQGRALVAQLLFGFSLEELFLRLDPDPQVGGEHPDRVELVFSRPRAHGGPAGGAPRPEQAGEPDQRRLAFRCRPGAPPEPVLDEAGARCGTAQCGAILELSVGLAGLGLAAGDRVQLSVRLLRDGGELERLPRTGGLWLTVPGSGFEMAHWQV